MSSLVVRNVRTFDPGSGLDARGRTIVVADGAIQDLDAPATAVGDRIIEARSGWLLVPGLVDLRAHLCEPGATQRETIATGVRSAAAGGYTTVVAMPTTEPTIDRPEVVELVQARARNAGPTRTLVAGALSVQRAGERLAEMGKLAAAGCVLFTDGDRAIQDSQLLRYALETAADVGLPVMTHAEDESLALGGVMHEGLTSTRLGLAGVPGAAEVVGVARDVELAELTQCRLHIGHISTAAATALVREAKRRGIRVSADASPLHLLLTDEAVDGYDTRAKITPPLRSAEDVGAVVAGLRDGTLDAVASDHCPRTELEKNVTFDRAATGAVGFETALPVLLTLVANGCLTLERAIAVVTRAPAEVLGRLDLGRLSVGGPADLALVDLEAEWTFERGEVRSRSFNSPLLGKRFVGRVVLTMARGTVTHDLLA